VPQQQRDVPRPADLIAQGRRGEALPERCPFARAQELDAEADRAAARRVLRPQAEVLVRQRVARRASEELAQRLEREPRQQVLALREPQPEGERRAQQASRRVPERALRQVFLTQLWLPHPSLLFPFWLSLRHRLRLEPGLE